MVYNARLRARRRKLESEAANIEVIIHHLMLPLLKIIKQHRIIIPKVS